MNANANKVKLIIVASICLLALLFVIVVAQIVSINLKNKELASQEETISQLEEKLNYYTNNTDDKSGDYEVEIKETDT